MSQSTEPQPDTDGVMSPPAAAPRFTPAQLATFNDLLAVGTDRPIARPDLAQDLHDIILDGTKETVATWSESSLWVGKSQVFTALDCEGKVVAERENPPDLSQLHPATAVGIAAHHAIQVAQTHRGHPAATYVRWAVDTLKRSDDKFAGFWADQSPGDQSNVLMQVTGKVNAFLNSWPDLRDEWSWRFEESVQARVGRLKLAARIDLVLGNPKPDGRQSMFLCDLKSGSLNDRHPAEADFYALVSTLRHGIPPYRSCVYSLAEGQWTDDPDVTETKLRTTADLVVTAVNRMVVVLTGEREAELTGGDHCRFCPISDTCPSSEFQPTDGSRT